MENTTRKVLEDSQDCQPEYEVSLEDCKVKIAINASNKVTMCDADVIFWNPSTSKHVSKSFFKYSEVEISINRDPRKWSETLYIHSKNRHNLFKEFLHGFHYMKIMKFTSCTVHLSILEKKDECKSAIKAVIEALNECKSCDLERVMILISDDMLQNLTPWFEENVTAPSRKKSLTEKMTSAFGLKTKMTWKKLPAANRDARLTSVQITGTNCEVVNRSPDAVQNGSRELTIQMKEESVKNEEMKEVSYPVPEQMGSHGVHPSQTDSPEKSHGVSKVFFDFKTEITKDVLDLILHIRGEKGITALVTDLKKKAIVDDSTSKVIISCDDFQDAEFVQTCVRNHYRGAKKEAITAQNTIKKHLIDGGNADTKELLQFAYSNTDWVNILTIEGGNLYLLGTLKSKEEVEAAVKTVNQWCQDDLFLTKDEQQKAAETLTLVRKEFPAVFIKQTGDRITIKADSADSFERAKHVVNVTLGRIKMISRGRRSLRADSTSFSSLPQDCWRERRPVSLPLDWQTSQHRPAIQSETYYTTEGITVKVYIGDIVRLPVDCIVNAANKNLSHGGGVALAIAKAAGREFDQESEDYVRRYGIIPVTKCCVTSAGKLPYKKVIHVVGPQWHDYKQDEKDRCGDDLKKTIVNCLIEAKKWNMTSIAVTSISSGIFGVPKDICAQMYVKGVIDFSRTYSLQSNSVQEIHFVDMLPEMCHVTQLAFDAGLNTRSSNEHVVSSFESQMKELSSRGQEMPTVKTEMDNFM